VSHLGTGPESWNKKPFCSPKKILNSNFELLCFLSLPVSVLTPTSRGLCEENAKIKNTARPINVVCASPFTVSSRLRKESPSCYVFYPKAIKIAPFAIMHQFKHRCLLFTADLFRPSFLSSRQISELPTFASPEEE
jgi:hypothetical protein